MHSITSLLLRNKIFPYTTLFRSAKPHAFRRQPNNTSLGSGIESHFLAGGISRSSPPLGFPAARRIASRSENNHASTIRTGTDRKSTRLNSSHVENSYAVFCLKKTYAFNNIITTEK